MKLYKFSMKTVTCMLVTGTDDLWLLDAPMLKFDSADVKPDNVFVNYKTQYGENESRFSDVPLGDFGSTYPADSKWARLGTPLGAPMWCSHEMIMETPWNTATDIWSFGAMVYSLTRCSLP